MYPSRQKRACGVAAEPLLGQMHQAHLSTVGWYPRCERVKWRPRRARHVNRKRMILIRPSSMPKSEPVLSQKRPLEDRSPCSSPPKKRATEEEERSMPPHEAVLPRGVTEEDILPKRYETFAADNGWVQHVRCSLLGLVPGTMPSRKDIAPRSTSYPRWQHQSQIYLR